MLKIAELPEKWKKSKLIYFVKPNRTASKPGDLRPISLINGFMKIGEALFAERIERHLIEKNFFVDNQFGYRKGSTIANAVQKIVNDIKLSRRYIYAVMISIDFSGAFDSLSWKIIVHNLERVDADRTFIKMTQSLLTGRAVQLDNIQLKTKRGTPQGGKASPLLFRIGMNNLIGNLNKVNNSRTTALADDTAIIVYSDQLNHLQIAIKIK
jgi:retron-type reverse transcriptase